ncbi:MAG: hypothetical protein D6698_17670 [Gammaproteobacteria bacterium]|nr:MAG: hypothetical protein D6698_17670 [Gammaproteobacteria bacterium]
MEKKELSKKPADIQFSLEETPVSKGQAKQAINAALDQTRKDVHLRNVSELFLANIWVILAKLIAPFFKIRK